MPVTFSNYVANEVGKVATTALGMPEGIILAKTRSTTNDYDLATDALDAILTSEVVTTEVATMRQHLMHDIDFSGYTRPGELCAIAKRVKGVVAYGLAITAQGADVNPGTFLEVNAGYLRPFAAGKKVAIVHDKILAGAVTTGRVLVLPVAL